MVIQDHFGNDVRRPLRPKRQTLEGTSHARGLNGSLTGRTWHGNWVTMTCMIGSDRPVDDNWSGGNRMAIDLEKREMRPVVRGPMRTLDVYESEREEQQDTAIDDTWEDARRPGGWSVLELRRCKSL